MADRSQSPAPVVIGMILEERFRLEASLGTGGMAEVFRATDLETGQRVAVKVLRASLETSPEAIQRFRREGEVLVRLKNPAIVAASIVGALADGRLYIVMELLEGETLGARLKRGPMSAAELAPVVAGCAVGLAAAHAAGVVHRDLKPDNVLLVPRPDRSVQVKLVDFGVSKVFNGEKLTQTGQVLGTPRYMSPEQLGAEPEVDHRVDLYSLGVILYEALSGRSPFLASTPTDLIVAILHGKAVPLRSVRPDVPPALEAVVMRAMARVRDARHRAATELADAFFDAAGIDARARPAQRHGMTTTPLGAMRAEGGGASFDDVSTGGVEDAAASALKLGTFSSFEAIDMSQVLGAQAAQSVQSTAPAPLGIGAEVRASAVEARTVAERAALPTGLAPSIVAAVAAPTPAPAAPRREIPATTLSPVVRNLEPTPQMLPVPGMRRDPSGAAPHRDPSGAATHEGGGSTAYPGRISRSSSASLAGAHAPRAQRTDGSQPSQGLLLVGVGLLAGALTAGVVVAVLTWATQMSGEGRSRPPPPPPRESRDAAGATADGGTGARGATATTGSGAAATGVIVPGATTTAAGSSGSGGEPASAAGSASAGSASASGGAGSTGATGATGSASGTGASGSSATGASGTSGAGASGSSSATGASSGATGASSGASPTGGSSSSGSSGGSRGGSSSGGATSSGGRSSSGSGTGGSSGSSGGSGSSSGGAHASDEAAATAAGTLAEATRALGRGDYAECVDILDDVIARGGTPIALRRRGDCLARMGEVREATRDYQRFCRLAPDHPAISEVRDILAGFGATCP